MARHEQDREDILREATALVERAEFVIGGYDQPIVIGFRRDGSGSIFVGPDPVYQYNSMLELRRAFIEGRLIKAEHGRLAVLTRRRTGGEVQLLRHDLNETETATLIDELKDNLRRLRDAIQQQRFKLVGQVPDDAEVVDRIRVWLDRLGEDIVIAKSPHAR